MLLAERLTIEEMEHLRRAANKKTVDMIITDHFFERWNERIENPKFSEKENLALYLEIIASNGKMERIQRNHHIIDDDIIIVAKKVKNKNQYVLVTTYGSTKNNPMLYNMCVSGDAEKNFKKYGKLNLDY